MTYVLWRKKSRHTSKTLANLQVNINMNYVLVLAAADQRASILQIIWSTALAKKHVCDGSVAENTFP